MNERELRTALDAKTKEYDAAKEAGKSTEELRKLVDEVKELRAKLDLELEMRANSIPELKEVVEPEVRKEEVDIEKEYRNIFMKIVRNRATNKDMNDLKDLEERAKAEPTATPFLKSATDENGGYIVPKDVQTKINEYKRTQLFDLSKLVTVETTQFTEGSRVFEKLATQTAFANIDEWDTINDIPAPQFEQKSYKMKSFAGILPTPRQLLQDTDQNLMDHLSRFIARKSLFTRNYKILEILNGLTKRTKGVAFTDDLKDILNVELDGAFAANAKIVTNQDGFNWLDKCKDEKGNYLIQRDVASATGLTLFGHEVVVVPNSTLASTDKKAPLFIGDLKEAVMLFDRGVYEVKGTDEGGKSFERNSYDIRVIDRFDVQKWDADAVVATEIDTTKEPAFPSTGKKTPQA